MNTEKRSSNLFLAITTLLAVGVLTGCQYCEPLLMATLVIALINKGLAYSPFQDQCAQSHSTLTSKFN